MADESSLGHSGVAGAGKPLGTVLHVGAGRGGDLDAYLHREARLVVLVEADPALARKLEARCAGRAGVRVIEAAVAGAGGPRVLHVLNNDRESGIRPPAALIGRYPNLKVRRLQPVDAVSLDDLCGGLPLDDDAAHELVIEAPGAEFEILAGADRNLLRRFASLVVRVGDGELYEGAQQAAEVDRLLRATGFRPCVQECQAATGGEPFRFARYVRDDAAIRIEALLEAVALTQARLDALGDSHGRQVQELDVLRGEVQASRHQLQWQTALAQSRQDEIEKLRLAIQGAKAERDAEAALVAELRALVAVAEARLADAAAESERRFAELEGVKVELGEAQYIAQGRQEEIEELSLAVRVAQAERDAETARVGELRARVADAEARLEAADRLQHRAAMLTLAVQEQTGLADVRKGRCEALESEVREQAGRIEDLEAALAEALSARNVAEARHAELFADLRGECEARVAAAEGASEALRQSLAVREAEFGGQEAQLHDMRILADNLEKRSIELSFQHQEQAGLAQARLVRIQSLESERAGLLAELESARHRIADCESGLAEYARQVEALSAEIEAGKVSIAHAEATAGDLSARIEQISAERAELDRRFDESVATNGLTARLLRLREGDLAELRQRYADLVAEKESRAEQLRALADRLQGAAQALGWQPGPSEAELPIRAKKPKPAVAGESKPTATPRRPPRSKAGKE